MPVVHGCSRDRRVAMMAGDVQILGLCRFSYPSSVEGFQKTDASPEALRTRLYAPRRLAERLVWFEHVALPAMRRQTDPAFTLVVMAGEQLPQPFRARLEALVAGLPQGRLVFLPEGQVHRLACRLVMQAHRDRAARAVGEFRLDDDDAVGTGFVADLRARFAIAEAMHDETGRVAVDYSRGLLLMQTDGALSTAPVQARLWTPALAIFRRPDDPISLLDHNHLDTWKLMPVLTLLHPVMFVRGVHMDNDSGLVRRLDRLDRYGLEPERMARLVRARFALDLSAMETALAAIPPA